MTDEDIKYVNEEYAETFRIVEESRSGSLGSGSSFYASSLKSQRNGQYLINNWLCE